MNEVENNTTFPDQITDSNEVLDSASTNEFMVLLKRSPETARLFFSFMTNKRAKRLYVQARHKQKIAPLNTTTKRYEGYWGTHIYVDGKRKAVLKPSEDKIYEYLYDFYHAQDDKTRTYEATFEQFIDSKRDRGRSELTLRDYRRYKDYF